MLNDGIQLSLVHNPLATIPLPRGILKAEKEYVADKNGNGYSVRLVSETSD